jgi:hypothetical protein
MKKSRKLLLETLPIATELAFTIIFFAFLCFLIGNLYGSFFSIIGMTFGALIGLLLWLLKMMKRFK